MSISSTTQSAETEKDGDKQPSLTVRQPTVGDGAAIDALIRACPPLDVNSQYCYLLICRDHAETSVVAEHEGDIVGFISAYVRPAEPDVVFVWQVAVAERARGLRLASRMLDEIVDRPACREVRFLETTVSPSNKPSTKLFERFAGRHGAELERTTLFSPDMFAGEDHEAEDLIRIGPFDR